MNWAVIGAYTPLFRQDDVSITGVLFALALTGVGALSGLFFYRLRGRHPFRYGCIEIVVGLIVLFFTFVPLTHNAAFVPQTLFEWSLTKLLGVTAGIYIIVRGLDNMDGDLPPSWRSRWDYFFAERKARSV